LDHLAKLTYTQLSSEVCAQLLAPNMEKKYVVNSQLISHPN
jgi:hypothetical protein